jgi:hypothetical protein
MYHLRAALSDATFRDYSPSRSKTERNATDRPSATTPQSPSEDLPLRDVNDRIREVAERLLTVDASSPVEFMCECGDLHCGAPVHMTVREYLALRQCETWYAVAPEHEREAGARVVHRDAGYVVIEKLDRSASSAPRLPRDGA